MASRETALERRRTRRQTAVVLVASVDRRILPALRFVARLPETDVRALHISVETEQTRRLAMDWIDLELTWLPLHIRDGAGEGFLSSVRRAVRDEAAATGEVTVVLPEVEHARWWHPFLHRRTARRIARFLQPLPDVNTVLVPYFVDCGRPGKESRGVD
jgi:hypothetical protein